MSGHLPVLLNETVAWLTADGRKTFIDCTVNGGGHALAILLKAGAGYKLLGLDRDKKALENGEKVIGQYEGVTLMHGSYAELDVYAERWGMGQVDGILADFGLSSNQLDQADRGFSYRLNGSLDMRYDQTASFTADDIVNGYTVTELADIIDRYGEERNARRIARAIVSHRPIKTTTELMTVVMGVVPKQYVDKTLARVYQSFRVEVNDELGGIEKLMPAALRWLKPGGRMVLLSYDSTEDRIVKTFIRQKARGCICPPTFPVCNCGLLPELKDLTGRVVRPSEEECKNNPRARSARLRVAEKITSS